jgi:putative transposon-encoded protein
MPLKKKPEAEEASPKVVESLRKGLNNVYYEKSVTKNLGNYESAKVTVGITLPIDPTEEEVKLIKATIIRADEIVTDELETQLKELVEEK